MAKKSIKMKRSARTSKIQQKVYVNYVTKHIDFATGKIDPNRPNLMKEHWVSLATELNRNGPPHRTTESWKKLFRIWRNQIRYKERQLKIEVNKTGRYPSNVNQLTDLEERALSAWSATTVVGVNGDATIMNSMTPATVSSSSADDTHLEECEIVDRKTEMNEVGNGETDLGEGVEVNETIESPALIPTNIAPKKDSQSLQQDKRPIPRRDRSSKDSKVNEIIKKLETSLVERAHREKRLEESVAGIASSVDRLTEQVTRLADVVSAILPAYLLNSIGQ